MSRDSKRTLTKVNERFALTQTNYLIFTFFHSYFTRSKRPCSLMPCDSYGKLLLTLGCLADVFPITRSPDHQITRFNHGATFQATLTFPPNLCKEMLRFRLLIDTKRTYPLRITGMGSVGIQ
jgi:hypothetical protein